MHKFLVPSHPSYWILYGGDQYFGVLSEEFRIIRWLLNFWKICGLLLDTTQGRMVFQLMDIDLERMWKETAMQFYKNMCQASFWSVLWKTRKLCARRNRNEDFCDESKKF